MDAVTMEAALWFEEVGKGLDLLGLTVDQRMSVGLRAPTTPRRGGQWGYTVVNTRTGKAAPVTGTTRENALLFLKAAVMEVLR